MSDNKPETPNDNDKTFADIRAELNKLIADLLGPIIAPQPRETTDSGDGSDDIARMIGGLIAGAARTDSDKGPGATVGSGSCLEQIDPDRPAWPEDATLFLRVPVRVVGTHTDTRRGLIPQQGRIVSAISTKPEQAPDDFPSMEYLVLADGTLFVCNGNAHIAVDVGHIVLALLADPAARQDIEHAATRFDAAHAPTPADQE